MFLSYRRRGALFIACSLLLVPPTRPQQSPQTPPDIRVSVDRVNVGVIVTDSRGQFISNLRPEDFHLFDNGVEQPITDFLNVDEPAQVLLLIEAGPAVYLLEGSHLRTVHALLDGLAPTDRVAIARYNEAPELIMEYTQDDAIPAGALEQLRFNLGFGQLNLASSLATALDWLTHVPGKKSVVLLSTGFDTSPPAAAQTLLPRLKSTDVRVLAISLGGELRNTQPPAKKERNKDQPAPDKMQAAAEGFARADEELKAITEANGSRVYFPRTSKDFAEVYREIAQLLRHEYNLGFVPPAHDGTIHSIEVRVTGSLAANSPRGASDPSTAATYRVDHRQAYVAPAAEHP